MYTQCRYIIDTIKSFKDKETEKIYHQGFCKRIPQGIAKVALRKLMMNDAAETLSDLKPRRLIILNCPMTTMRASGTYG